MKITDLKCATIGSHLVLRIVTDEGIDGFSQGETSKPYLKDPILRLKEFVVGQDPTDVERVMRRNSTAGRGQTVGHSREYGRDGTLGHCWQSCRPAGL